MRITILSGSQQTAPAYVAPSSKNYITDFPAPLVARLDGVPPNVLRHVRYRCVSKDCSFVPTDQPNEGHGINRADDGSYGVETARGRAALRVAIKAAVPAGTYTVQAEPVVRKGERGIPASFTLTSR